MEPKDYETLREELLELLQNKEIRQFREIIVDMNEYDVATFISELPKKRLAMVFRLLPKDMSADVFAHLDVEEQQLIIECIEYALVINVVY